MMQVDITKLQPKDKMLIAKAVADIALAKYKDNNNFILNQIIANGRYDSIYGQFTKKHVDAKTVQEVINSKKDSLAKLQDEIAQLEALEDKTAIYTEATDTLVCKHHVEADDIARDLLKELYTDLGYNRLTK